MLYMQLKDKDNTWYLFNLFYRFDGMHSKSDIRLNDKEAEYIIFKLGLMRGKLSVSLSCACENVARVLASCPRDGDPAGALQYEPSEGREFTWCGPVVSPLYR